MNKILILPLIFSQAVFALDSDTNNVQQNNSTQKQSNITSKHSWLLDNLIATGSPLASDTSKIPGNVSTVDKEHITQLPNQKAADIVKKLAGVTVQRDVGFNPRPAIKIRGINYGTLIMLDDVILSDLEGENRILNQISLYDIERVEVARGAFSSLYGTNAMGGVINFITSMPTTLQLEAIAGYGSEFQENTADKNTLRFYASIGNAFLNKRLRTKISGSFNSSEGYASFPTYPNIAGSPDNSVSITQTGWFTDKEGRKIIGDGGRRDTTIWDMRAKAEYDTGDTGMLSGMFSISNHSYDFKNFTSYLRDSNGNVVDKVNGKDYFVGSGWGGMGSYTHILGNLSYQHEFDESFLKVSLSTVNLLSFWQDADNNNGGDRFGGAGTSQDINTSSNYLDILYNFSINDKHSLATALQFRYLYLLQENYQLTNWRQDSNLLGLPALPNRQGKSTRAYGSHAVVASTYANISSQWLDNLSTNLGLRYDYWQNFRSFARGDSLNVNPDSKPLQTSQFSPKASINYNIFPFWLLRAGIGSGFRMPTLREAYPPNSHGIWQANADLKPEVGISFEVGSELRNQYIDLSIYYFQTELFDMIYRSGAGTQANPRIFRNAGYGRINGVEVSVAIPIYDMGNWGSLNIEGNYTLTNAKVLKNNADTNSIGKQLPEVPLHVGNIALHLLPAKTFTSSKKSQIIDKEGTTQKPPYRSGLYMSIWAYFTSAFFDDSNNSPVLSQTFGHHEAQFTLNTKVGYLFDKGLDLSAQFLNITNNRYYDFYRVAGASFYIQARYKWGKA
ncbi:TonB-dependent receptor [Helicobacter aurati]|uniref:TonB-dependent receptor n=1 Tax=Helicobacter aurati TaxID=137778 RepID=A0A3D8J8R8_9HELI|nr:TonB-dependent receptor [Helicobacter aurati]RDU73680.1 TonB-dependent receptor [Helicobacter aurati]